MRLPFCSILSGTVNAVNNAGCRDRSGAGHSMIRKHSPDIEDVTKKSSFGNYIIQDYPKIQRISLLFISVSI